MELYSNKHYEAKYNAQNNLEGRTHYVDPDTLKFHRSRILQAKHTDSGLLFAIIESCSADYEHKSRVFRPVVFDVFGTVLARPDLEDSYKTHKQAEKAMWELLNSINAEQVTLEGIKHAETNHKREMDDLRGQLKKLKDENYI